jgi:hypothetical protein
MTLGQIDYHLFTPWLPAERWLYPPVHDFLADWSRTQPPSFVAFRIVGRQWEPSSHRPRVGGCWPRPARTTAACR